MPGTSRKEEAHRRAESVALLRKILVITRVHTVINTVNNVLGRFYVRLIELNFQFVLHE